uniref:OmpA-like domain-containing protein n=1 Tax=Paraburkholderia sprentiae WSM5005 TaxID=754502 RepID=A0A1I9YKT9_9BURK
MSAQACNTSHNLPGQNIDLYFERNSTQVSAGQVLKLANWAIDMRLKYPIQEVLSIGGLAEASEKEPKKLAVQRADTAKAILMQFDLTETSYDVRAGIYKPLDYFVEPSEKVRRAEIELSPGCPNNCCDGK